MEHVPFVGQDEISIDEDDPNVVLGEGAFGIVYRGKCRGLNVAVKMPKAFDLTDEQLTEFMEEVQMMAKLYHPRIALFLGACVNGKEISVVSEMLDGDIEHVILRDSSISLLQRMLWARQAALGMAWVHGAGIIHRDLKPSNLLYSKSENAVKVCDFGFTILVKDKRKAQQTRGSPFYMAPELLRGEGASRKTDVYAFGIILHFLITGELVPFAAPQEGEVLDVSELFSQVLAGVRPRLPDGKRDCPSTLRSLAERCWSEDPLQRPEFEEILVLLNEDVLVDCAVFSGKGRKLWKTCFGGKELREAVPLQEFAEQFFSYFGSGLSLPDAASAEYKVIREIFAKGEVVKLPTYGRMLGFFGRLEKAVWLEQTVGVFRQPWFWGDTSREVACQKLAAEQRGAFLVRYASEDSYFTISYVASNAHDKREIFHTRVVHNYASTHYSIPARGGNSRTCSSLLDIVSAVKEGTSHMVNKACPGGPYTSFFHDSSDSGYEVGNTGYRLADVDVDPDEIGSLAAQGSLKDSNANVFRHRLVADIHLHNNSPSPAVEKKGDTSKTSSKTSSPALEKKPAIKK